MTQTLQSAFTARPLRRPYARRIQSLTRISNRPPPANPHTVFASTASDPLIDNLHRSLSSVASHLRILQQRRAAERAAERSTQPCPSSNPNGSGASYEPEACVICFEPLTCPESVVTLCGHVFHNHCLLNCPGADRGGPFPCPICRRTVHSGETIHIVNGLPTAPDNPSNTNASNHTSPAASPRRTPQSSPQRRRSIVNLISDDEGDHDLSEDDLPLAQLRQESRAECRSTSLGEDIDNALKRTLAMLHGIFASSVAKLREARNEEREKGNQARQKLKESHDAEVNRLQRERQQVLEDRAELTKVKARELRLMENITAQREELQEAQAAVRKKEDKLFSARKELEASEEALQVKQRELSEQDLALRRKAQRLEELNRSVRKRAQSQETTAKSSRDSNTTSKRRKPISLNKRDDEDDDSDNGCLVEQVEREIAASKRKAREEAVKKAIDPVVAFGGQSLHNPSKINRPLPPRLGRGPAARAGLSSFVGQRAGVQKPLRSVGKKAGARRV